MSGKDSNPLYSLFGELYRQGQNGQYESALKTANKSKSPQFSVPDVRSNFYLIFIKRYFVHSSWFFARQ